MAAVLYRREDIQRAHLVEWDFDDGVPRGMEHVIIRVKAYYKVDTQLLSLTVFTLLAWNTKWILPRTRCMCSRSHPFVAMCCGGAQDSLFFELGMGYCCTLRFMTGVHPGYPLDPSPFCMLVDPGLREMREHYDSLRFYIILRTWVTFSFRFDICLPKLL